MRASGFERFLEIGPGRVLAGLTRNIDRAATTVTIGKVEEIESFAVEGTE